MKTTRTYSIICPSCRGVKIVPNPNFNLSNIGELLICCPACNGTGVVICMETTEETTKTETE